MKIVKADQKGILLAIQYLRVGKAVVYPTDTAYGLGVDATNLVAVQKLYQIKGRSFSIPVHVMVVNLAQAKRYAKFSPEAEKVFKKMLPGPLSLVLKLHGANKALKFLSAGTGMIGIRMPDDKTAIALVRKFGKPITTTSANLAGDLTPYSIPVVLKQFRSQEFQPDLCLDAGNLPKIKPSTIIGVDREEIKLLRPGPISLKQIEQAIK